MDDRSTRQPGGNGRGHRIATPPRQVARVDGNPRASRPLAAAEPYHLLRNMDNYVITHEMMIQGVSDGGPDGATIRTPSGALMGKGFYPAMGGGGFAHAQELGPWLDLIAVRGEVMVPFWLKPGEAAVTLGVGEERREERIPAQLKRFL